jgi:inner membrane protein
LHPAGFLFATLIAALLPDIDTGTSFFGKHIKPLNHFLEHRTFFHSILFMTMVAISAAYLGKNTDLAIAVFIGMTSHLFLDTLNPAGVYLFWPAKVIARGKFKMGGIAEIILFVAIVLAIFWTLYYYNITSIGQFFP